MLRATLTGMKKATAIGALSLVACSSASAGWFQCCGQNKRPYYDPSCEPNWGVQETTWRRFPSSHQYGQGSYCPDGGCQPSVDASYMNGPVAIPSQSQAAPTLRNAPSAGATAQPLLIQPPQQMQLQLPGPGYSASPTISPVFEAPAPAIPYGVPQQPASSAPMMSTPRQSGNLTPLMAPQPASGNSIPMPQPSGGQGMMPMNQTPANGGSSNPVPMPMENLPLPPMPGANTSNQYQSPFNNVGYPVYQNQPMGVNANYGQPAQVTPSVPVKNISYQGQAQQPKSKNPFAAISRMWSRRK